MKTRPTSELIKLIVRGAASEEEQAEAERELDARLPVHKTLDDCTCLVCLGYPTRNP